MASTSSVEEDVAEKARQEALRQRRAARRRKIQTNAAERLARVAGRSEAKSSDSAESGSSSINSGAAQGLRELSQTAENSDDCSGLLTSFPHRDGVLKTRSTDVTSLKTDALPECEDNVQQPSNEPVKTSFWQVLSMIVLALLVALSKIGVFGEAYIDHSVFWPFLGVAVVHAIVDFKREDGPIGIIFITFIKTLGQRLGLYLFTFLLSVQFLKPNTL